MACECQGARCRVQVDAEVRRLTAENQELLRQVRDLDNKATLAARDLSNSGAAVVAVRPGKRAGESSASPSTRLM
jgi:hypothetical protein